MLRVLAECWLKRTLHSSGPRESAQYPGCCPQQCYTKGLNTVEPVVLLDRRAGDLSAPGVLIRQDFGVRKAAATRRCKFAGARVVLI